MKILNIYKKLIQKLKKFGTEKKKKEKKERKTKSKHQILIISN